MTLRFRSCIRGHAPSRAFRTSSIRLPLRRLTAVPTALLVLGLSILPLAEAHSQASGGGVLRGIVIDYTSGAPVDGASVRIQGSATGATSDRYGRFQVRGMDGPGAAARIRIESDGYAPLDAQVEWPAADTLQFALRREGREGDRVFVMDRDAAVEGGARQERAASGLVTVLTSQQMARGGAFTAADGLARMAGVQVSRTGELNLRGTGRELAGVLVDGQPMPGTVPSSRAASLDAIATELIWGVRRVDLRSADQQAEGIGPAIVLDTWRPVGERRLSVSVAGLSGQRYNAYIQPGQRIAARYAERFTPAFSLDASFSWQQESEGYETLGISFLPVEFAGGTADVPDRVAPGLGYDAARRGGGFLQLTYEPDARTSYRVRGLLTVNRVDRTHHRLIYDAAGDWLDPAATGLEGSQGTFGYNPSLNRDDLSLYMVSATGRRFLDAGQVSFEAGWSRSVVDLNRYDFMFSDDRLDYALEPGDRLRPVLVPTNVNLLEDGTLDQRTVNFGTTERIRDEHELTRLHARADAARNMGPVEFKAGAYYSRLTKERGYEEASLRTLRTYPLLRFNKIPRSRFEILDRYYVPNLVDPTDVARYLDTSRPDLRVDLNDLRRLSLPGNVSTTEQEWAGYGMAVLQAGAFDIQAGVRYEAMSATLDAQRVLFNQFGFFESTRDTSRTVSRSDWFPSLRITYRGGSSTRVSAGYSKTVQRPDAALAAPFELVLPKDTLVFAGNPDLAPILADQLELRATTAVGRSGELQIGAYAVRMSGRPFLDTLQKALPDFPFLTVSPGTSVDAHVVTPQNRPGEATVVGAEIRWRQSLQSLPGWLGRTAFEIGYGWSDSEQEATRGGEALPLAHQSPHSLNLALEYDHGRFSVRMDGHWSAPSLAAAAADTRPAPSLPGAPVLHPDLYEHGWLDASLFAGFRISEQFRLWVNAQNLLPQERILYVEDPDVYPVHLRIEDSIRLLAGLRFDL